MNFVMACLLSACWLVQPAHAEENPQNRIVYIAPDLGLLFWRTLSDGVAAVVESRQYRFETLTSQNSREIELQHVRRAIANGVAGIVLTPTDSSSAPAALELAAKHGMPVVIADIGTDGGDYVSFVSADDYAGGKRVGETLATALVEKGWQDAPVGIVAISQARRNGQDRTRGFDDGLAEAGFTGQIAPLRQMQSYSAKETEEFVRDMLTETPGLRALFVQTDQPAMGALRAIREAERQGEVLLAAFDGIPAFVEPLREGAILVSGMQQPRLMGMQAGEALVEHLAGGMPARRIMVPILIVTPDNIDTLLPRLQDTVFGEESSR